MHRRLAAAATICATLLLAACTEQAPQPPPPPTPGPTMPSDPPTSATPSPSPKSDPEAADRAAVENAYRAEFAEVNRLEIAGGATKPTPTLRATASGQNLEHLMTFLKNDHKLGTRQVNSGRLAGVVAGSGTATRRELTACEDYSRVKWSRHGKPLNPGGPRRVVQRATAIKGKDGKWRIDLVRSTAVKSFPDSVCRGT
jgi:hypothetical protein